MKKTILIFLLFITFGNLFAQDLNYAKRLLKLANTNIWLENYERASDLVYEAKDIIAKFNTWEAKYWDAVADETLGQIFFQMGNYDFAESHFLSAHKKYNKLINSNYEGSQVATKHLIEKTRQKTSSNTLVSENRNGKVVNLSYANVAGYLNLPSDIVSFVAVKSNISTFPAELYGKKSLRNVVLKNNNLSNVMVRDMPSLEYLDLSKNNITEILIDTSSVRNLKYLNLSNNNLQKIPPEIFSMKNLRLLDLTNNNIPFSAISNLISNLPNTTIIFDRYERIEEEEEEEY
ncbi:MAG: leucine-rich repeat domain-containing protein [Ignavibacteria bacterium]|nr:leucine-rich repeat domain-containing protein [Ignavibacteria bacterium]